MKNLLLAISIFFALNSNAQNIKPKVDTVYYLLNILKTPVNDRMWEVEVDGKFKQYIIQCPCLKYSQSPTFLYRPNIDSGVVIDRKKLSHLKLTSIPSLINNYQKFYSNHESYHIFIIEPFGKQYIYHKVNAIGPIKPMGITN
jgi:hypothetical protein